MKKTIFIAVILIFFSIITFTSHSAEVPLGQATERPSPHNHISEDNIVVYDNKVVIYIQGVSWTGYEDTNSMDPVLDAEANGLEIVPDSPENIYIGDIVAYETPDGLVVHRVVEKGEDEEGIYFILKGDNNSSPDPEKIRFDQIKYLLVGIIY